MSPFSVTRLKVVTVYPANVSSFTKAPFERAFPFLSVEKSSLKGPVISQSAGHPFAVGPLVGDEVGERDGLKVGEEEGLSEGLSDGE